MSERRVIGFDRELRLEWLDVVASRAAESAGSKYVRAWLDEYLSDTLGGVGRGGNRGKTITVLCRIWLNVPKACRPLRDHALELLPVVKAHERLGLHWGMCMAVYPFFCEVAATIGRLVALQGDVERRAVLQRMSERWGDRPAVSRGCRAVWGSVIRWGVLQETPVRGRYERLSNKIRVSPTVSRFLVNSATLSAGPRPPQMTEWAILPSLFPFEQRDGDATAAASGEIHNFEEDGHTISRTFDSNQKSTGNSPTSRIRIAVK